MRLQQLISHRGGPGSPPRWTSSTQTGVGTALSNKSHVWFTLSHGIFNEIYYPRIDHACVRDIGLIVTDGVDFFSEEKRDAGNEVEWLADGVPGWPLPHRKADCNRSASGHGVTTGPVHRAARRTFRLAPSCPARAAPGKPGQRQYRMAGRIRGHATAACSAGRKRIGAGLLRSVDEAVCRLRRPFPSGWNCLD